MKILVTGAGGFLGATVVRSARDGGHFVRALLHHPDPAYAADEILTGDLTDPALWKRAVTGVNAVIHCAGITPVGRLDPVRSQRVNVDATAGLYAAAGCAGVARWVQISSMSAHAESTSVYGRSKFEADQGLRTGSGRPAWVILRPSLIYGPGVKGLLGETVARLRRLPFVPVVGDGQTPLRPVHVGDVAEAALRALTVHEAAGRTFMIGGADEVTLDTFFRTLCAAAGLRRPFLHIPVPLALLLSKILCLALSSPPLNADNVLGICEAQRVDIAETIAVLGLKPRGLSQGLASALHKIC